MNQFERDAHFHVNTRPVLRVMLWLLVLILALGLLGGCTSKPEEPCFTLECMKAEKRKEITMACRQAALEEYREEIMVGFYDTMDILDACRRMAEDMVP